MDYQAMPNVPGAVCVHCPTVPVDADMTIPTIKTYKYGGLSIKSDGIKTKLGAHEVFIDKKSNNTICSYEYAEHTKQNHTRLVNKITRLRILLGHLYKSDERKIKYYKAPPIFYALIESMKGDSLSDDIRVIAKSCEKVREFLFIDKDQKVTSDDVLGDWCGLSKNAIGCRGPIIANKVMLCDGQKSFNTASMCIVFSRK